MTEKPELADDGACRHLPGMHLPSMELPATDGTMVDLSTVTGRVVLYAHPRTSRPGEPTLDDWDSIRGARGCTPQSCAFRDHYSELRSLNVAEVYGLSTQDSAYQREMVERLHLPFAVLSDAWLEFATALRLPTFTTSGHVLLKRMTLIIDNGTIRWVFYPVASPERNPQDVIAWLQIASEFTLQVCCM
jgi:peroxiredoxin